MKSARVMLVSNAKKLSLLALSPINQMLRKRKAWHRFRSSLRLYKQLTQGKTSVSESEIGIPFRLVFGIDNSLLEKLLFV